MCVIRILGIVVIAIGLFFGLEEEAKSRVSREDKARASRAKARRAKARQAEARQAFRSGLLLYGKKKYREALREFSISYRLSRQEDLLFNIARCHDILGELELALSFYKQYHRSKGAKDSHVRDIIKSIEERIRRRKRKEKLAEASRLDLEKVAIPPTPLPSWAKNLISGGIAGLGLTSVVIGVAMSITAKDREQEIRTKMVEDFAHWRDIKHLDSNAEVAGTLGVAGIVVGGVLGVVAALLHYWLFPSGEPTSTDTKGGASPVKGAFMIPNWGRIGFSTGLEF